MTEPFSPNALPYATNVAASVAGAQAGASVNVSPVTESEVMTADQIDFQPTESPSSAHIGHGEWQANESDLLPSFGVERARELLMWLINLELRLPPYTEVSPA